MTRRQKREYVLIAYGNDACAIGGPGCSDKWFIGRHKACLDALAAIDAGRRWAQVLREFER